LGDGEKREMRKKREKKEERKKTKVVLNPSAPNTPECNTLDE
jgi:hypothetical protein